MMTNGLSQRRCSKQLEGLCLMGTPPEMITMMVLSMPQKQDVDTVENLTNVTLMPHSYIKIQVSYMRC